jgi:hypothetical protein
MASGTATQIGPRAPRALAGRLRRAQTFQSNHGHRNDFSPRGTYGNADDQISSAGHDASTVSTVSTVYPQAPLYAEETDQDWSGLLR